MSQKIDAFTLILNLAAWLTVTPRCQISGYQGFAPLVWSCQQLSERVCAHFLIDCPRHMVRLAHAHALGSARGKIQAPTFL